MSAAMASQTMALVSSPAVSVSASRSGSREVAGGKVGSRMASLSARRNRGGRLVVKASDGNSEVEEQVKLGNWVEQPTAKPAERRWTGYIEKDTAGQTNIYSVEPTVYVGETISTNERGQSGDGNTTLLFAGTVLIFTALAAASTLSIVQSRENGTAPQPSAVEEVYSGPPLSYYIKKWAEPARASAPAVVEVEVVAEVLDAPTLSFE